MLPLHCNLTKDNVTGIGFNTISYVLLTIWQGLLFCATLCLSQKFFNQYKYRGSNKRKELRAHYSADFLLQRLFISPDSYSTRLVYWQKSLCWYL